jgi:hypothetical protein
MSIKMDLMCTRCKAGWKVEGMPEQFYKDALVEFFDNHRACVKVAAKTVGPDAQHTTRKPETDPASAHSKYRCLQ